MFTSASTLAVEIYYNNRDERYGKLNQRRIRRAIYGATPRVSTATPSFCSEWSQGCQGGNAHSRYAERSVSFAAKEKIGVEHYLSPLSERDRFVQTLWGTHPPTSPGRVLLHQANAANSLVHHKAQTFYI